MITREDMVAALKKKERQSSRDIKLSAKKTIDNATKAIQKGVFHLPNGPASPEVFELVRKSFKKEGIDVKMEVKEIHSKSRKMAPHSKRVATYRFSLLEDQ